MRPRTFQTAAVLTLAPLFLVGVFLGCEKKKPEAGAPTAHDDHDGHDHGPDDEHEGHGGAMIALGEQSIGSFKATATRDEGEIVAGKDAPIDVTVTPTAGTTAEAVAVRFWIGTRDAKGSVKAKAEIEDPKGAPERWHVHVEIPNPLPEGSTLWVEIEDDTGTTAVGGFDLKM